MSSISYIGGQTGIIESVELPEVPSTAGDSSANILDFLADLVEALASTPLFTEAEVEA